MRVLVSSTQGSIPLTALLALRGTIFALPHPLNPIHQAGKANLRDPTAAWLFDRRFNEACVAPSGTGDVQDSKPQRWVRFTLRAGFFSETAARLGSRTWECQNARQVGYR